MVEVIFVLELQCYKRWHKTDYNIYLKESDGETLSWVCPQFNHDVQSSFNQLDSHTKHENHIMAQCKVCTRIQNLAFSGFPSAIMEKCNTEKEKKHYLARMAIAQYNHIN